ncbi:MFS transporter [Demequina sp. NBRC 110053]|uniref:MFS transporter n=1 Tax=Demequina sp. NBRC 110053 TaxID=1570342 RepID=UPI000A03BA5A|nr:MFS transporter [Demequina sp. NBRC 110053]
MPLVYGYPPTTSPTDARVRSARWGVLGLFALMGAMLSTFLSRMPSVRDLLDVSVSGLANLIIFGSFGALAGLMVTGWAAARFGTRALLFWSTVSHVAAFSLVAVSTVMESRPLFAVGHFFVSFSFAFTNVAMNAEAANVERRMGRAVMPQFHAAFSIGMAVALGIGALVSHAGIPPVTHFIAAAAVATVVRLAIIPAAAIDGMPDPDAAGATLGGPFATARAEYKERRVVLIGLIVFAASMTEMTAAQWMSIAVVDEFDRTESVGDLIYWVFVVSMVTVRWFGAPIIGRLGRVVSLRASAVAVVAGLLLFALAPALWLVPLAAMLWGLGAALGVPIAFSAAADDPKRAAARVAAVASFSTVAGLMVPPLIGNLGELVPMNVALLVVSAASITSFALARAVRKDGRLLGSRRAAERRVGSARLALADKDGPAIAPGAATGTGAPDAPVRGE